MPFLLRELMRVWRSQSDAREERAGVTRFVGFGHLAPQLYFVTHDKFTNEQTRIVFKNLYYKVTVYDFQFYDLALPYSFRLIKPSFTISANIS